MTQAVKVLVLFAILACLAPIVASADAVSLQVFCQGFAQYSNQLGDSTCFSSISEAEAGASTFAPGGLTAEIFANASDDAFEGAMAIATYTTEIAITITDGSSEGVFGRYAPCVSLGAGGVLSPTIATATFGAETFSDVNGGGFESCPGSGSILFGFGVTQMQQFSLYAGAAGGGRGFETSGSAFAMLDGFMVYDQNGNLLPGADVTVEAIPEPGLLVPLGVALTLGWSLRRPPVFAPRESHWMKALQSRDHRESVGL